MVISAMATRTVAQTKNDLDVGAQSDGLKEARTKIPSHFNGATAGNNLAGDVIGALRAIDAATGRELQ